MLRRAVKSMPDARRQGHAREQVGLLGLTAARSAVDDLLLGHAGRDLLADDAVEDDVGGVAQDLRADDGERHADDREHDDEDDPRRLRPERSRAGGGSEPLKFLGFSGGQPDATERAAATRRAVAAAAARAGAPPGRSCRLLRAELRVDDLAVGLARRHQLGVGPDADDPAAVEDDDPVGAHDRADPLGDDDRRWRPSISRARAARRQRVGLEVERREAVVEDVDLGPLDQRPGDRQALALAARQVRAALRDRRVEALGQLADEVSAWAMRRARPQLLVGRVGLAEAEVAGDRAAEQEGLLGDEPDPRPEVVAVAARGRRRRRSSGRPSVTS